MLENPGAESNKVILAKERILDAVAKSDVFEVVVSAVSVGYFTLASVPLAEIAARLADKSIRRVSAVKTRLLQAPEQ